MKKISPTIHPTISGFGAFTPDTVVTNDDLSKWVNTNHDWIVARTGIKERRFADEMTTNVDIGFFAAKNAIEDSGLSVDSITHILYATCTPDAACPSTACLLEAKLGTKGKFALDINAACSGFLYGLEVSRAITIASPKSSVLLVASETLSKHCNWEDRSTCIVFADGAGAAIISGSDVVVPGKKYPQGRIIDVVFSSDGTFGDLLIMNGGFSSHPYKLGDTVGAEYFIQMNGREVYKHGVRSMGDICLELLEKNNMTIGDIDVFVPHQANLRIIEAVRERLGIDEKKVFVNVDKYGNTSAASVPIALNESLDCGMVKQGDTVLVVAFGSGFTWAASLLQF